MPTAIASNDLEGNVLTITTTVESTANGGDESPDSLLLNDQKQQIEVNESPIVKDDEKQVVEDEKVDEEDEGVQETPTQIVFPPQINWNGNHAAASRPELFAYLSGSVIVVAKVNDTKKQQELNGSRKYSGYFDHGAGSKQSRPSWPTFTIMGAQKDAYTSICCSQQEWDLLPFKDSPIITGDSAGFVKMWNTEEKVHPTYHTAHKPNSVQDVAWSPRDPNLVYSVDVAGLMTIWNIREKSLKTNNYDRPAMSCISVNPYEDHIVAVGFKSGSILIVDTSSQTGEILHKMNHNLELISLSWVPKEFWDNITLEAHHKTPLLISSIFTIDEATIRVWDREGNDVSILSLGEQKENVDAGVAQIAPARSVQRKQFKTFVPTAWIHDPKTQQPMLFSSFKNNIVQWKNLNDPFTVTHDIHRIGAIFTMVQTRDILWSFGSESMIVGYNLRIGEKDVIAPTFNGICNLHGSPVIRSQIAFGGGDGILRIVNMIPGFPQTGPYEPPVVIGRIPEAKITAVCWHPLRDNLVGLGTNEGVLGVYEYRDNNRFSKLCERRVPGTVYGLDWGPPTYTKFHEEKRQEKYGNKEDCSQTTDGKEKAPVKTTLMLYACGGNGVHMINPMHINANLINVGSIIYQSNLTRDKPSKMTSKATDIRWCPDRQFFCVGYVDGRIDIFTPPYLKLKCTIKCHTREIQHLAWRPYDFGPDTDSLSKWFASSSNDGTIRLYNLAELYSTVNSRRDNNTNNDDENNVLSIRQSATTLNGHSGIRVISLAWSPHDPKLLVSVSYDRSAVVWNIIDGTPVARYLGHLRRLVGCMFHPSHKYQVITCSDELVNDFSMHVWDYRDYPHKQVPDKIISQVANMKQAIKAERIQKEQEPVRLGSFTHVEKGSVYAGVDGDGAQNMMTTIEEHSQIRNNNNVVVFKKSNITSENEMNSLLPLASSLLNKEPNAKVGIQKEIMNLIQFVDPSPSESNKEHKRQSVDPSIKKLVMNIGLGEFDNAEDQGDDDDGEESGDSDGDGNIDGSDSDDEGEDAEGYERGFRGVIASEIDNHVADGRWKNAMHLSSWTGKHSQIVEMALKKNELCESVIKTVLANPYDSKFRCEVIAAYAKKLIAQNDIPSAVDNLLLIGHDEEAVYTYLDKNYHHEAFALAKTRLMGPVKEEAMKKIHESWAAFLKDQGEYLQALRMYTSTKQYSKALEVLELWNTAEAWETGISIVATMSTKDDRDKYGDYFGMKFIEDALANHRYDQCLKTIKNNSFLNWLLPIVLMHQQLTEMLNRPSNDSSESGILNNFAQTILSSWTSNGILPENYESQKEKILALLKVVIPQTKSEAFYVIARYLSLIILNSENASQWNSDSQYIIKTWLPNTVELSVIEGCRCSIMESVGANGLNETEQHNAQQNQQTTIEETHEQEKQEDK